MERFNNNSNRQFKCFCGQLVSYEQANTLKTHIENCQVYQDSSPFFKYFKRLDLSSLTEDQLMAIHTEMSIYVSKITSQLATKGYVLPQQQMQRPMEPPRNEMSFQSLRQPANNLMMSSRFFVPPPKTFNQDQVQCSNCKKNFDSNFDSDKIYYLDTCLHVFCKGCLLKQINSDYVETSCVLCKVCSKEFTSYDYNALVGREKFEVLEQKAIQKLYNLVACVKCKQQFEFVSGTAGQNVSDNNGNLLTPALQIHYAENRFICQNSECKIEQCRNCQATPYHLGYDCESFVSHKLSKRCRYCDDPISKVNKNLPLALQDICPKEECIGKIKHACTKMNPCNHPCFGLKDELNCLPCLNPSCAKDNVELRDTDSDQYCNVCWSEGLGTAPCVQLACKHVFHFHCIKKRLEVKWISARIVFNFCFCPLCKAWMDFPLECELAGEMQRNMVLYENIQKKSMDRLKFEERLKDKKLIDVDSPYHNQPQEYAMAIYAYFMCFKCQKPYFGGLKDCQRGLEEDKREFDPKELVCANCCEIPVENCPKHGNDYIEFKCKFCCSVAQWFCWGTTHFCESCHKKQCNGDYVSKYPKDKLPVCQGGDKCPVGGNHKPNGEETALGCSLCRNARDNQKAF